MPPAMARYGTASGHGWIHRVTAGAQKQMMSFIDQLGVNNIIVDAHEAVDRNELQTVRSISPGLSLRDYRAIQENVQ